ncbi:MAG TPA: DUF2059 domain-containing protein [Rhodanobacteraceae bacterium]|nr:DUF2059 domain-containing protein [Rhodanobacteraceae bacterium]
MRLHALAVIGLCFAFAALPAYAAENAANEASIQELLQVTQAHKLVDTTMAQMDGMLRKSVQQAMAGHPVDAGEQKILDAEISKLNDLLMQQMSWDKMEPMYINLYRETFTQKEIDDMLAFYRTPSGQSMISKMPVLMAHLMQMVQGMMVTLMPQVQKINQDTIGALEAYETSKKNAPQAPAAAATSGHG